jgi:hypothetical protein
MINIYVHVQRLLIARTYAKGWIDQGVQLLIVMNFEGGWEFEL